MKSLENFSAETFLNEYWQKKPLLIKSALSPAIFRLSPDELAGMALEEDIESRLITGNVEQGFELHHGPLEENHFSQLGEYDWTLLVQAVDHWVPEVTELKDYFSFIPHWRIDDVMVSYATPGGSVGPHYDNYDVFLIQGLGKREWRIGQQCSENTERREDQPLMLINDFQEQQRHILAPGDILYLPPGLAHWGIALAGDDHCMTYSVGFRAPSYHDILSHFCDHLLDKLNKQQRYQDPLLSLTTATAEIPVTALDQLSGIIENMLEDKTAQAEWFGRFMTDPKYPDLHQEEDQDFQFSDIAELLEDGVLCFKNPSSRFAYQIADHGFQLFVDGEHYPCAIDDKEWLESLCNQSYITPLGFHPEKLSLNQKNLLCSLFNKGCLYFHSDNDEDLN